MTLRRKLALVAGLYFVEGFPMGVYADVWPVFLRDSGLSRTAIGFLSGIGFAWSVKALWAPLLDRYGEWRRWIACALVAMALATLAVPGLAAGAGPALVAAAIAAFCLASATQDVAIDAYAVGLTDAGEEGPLSAVRVTAYRLGKLAFGAGALVAADALGWGLTHQAIAAATLLFALGVLAAPRVQPAAPERFHWREALGSLRRPELKGALAFLLVYRIGDLAIAPMIGPFWRDSGMSLTQIGTFSTGLSALVGIAGAAAGGWIVARSLAGALTVGGVLSALSNVFYALAAWVGAPFGWMVAASFAESF